MSEEIIKYLKNSIDEKGNYCYSLPVETTKTVIKQLNRLNNIINELEKYLEEESKYDEYVDLFYREHMGNVLDILKKLKENNNNE